MEQTIDNGTEPTFSDVLKLIKQIDLKIGADISSHDFPSAFLLPHSTNQLFYKSFIKNFNVLLKANKTECKEERMLLVFRFVTASFMVYESLSKRPVNGLLGETKSSNFSVVNYDNENETIDDNSFMVEHVCENPPRTASCIYNKRENVKVNFNNILTGIFEGTSFKSIFAGTYTITLGNYNETYSITVPDVFVRILRNFYEHCGTLTIKCSSNNILLQSEFHAKPMLYGSVNSYDAKVFDSAEPVTKKSSPIYKISGIYDGESKITNCKTNQTKPFYSLSKKQGTITPSQVDYILPTDSSIVWKQLTDANQSKGDLAIAKSKVVEHHKSLNWKVKHFKKNESTDVWELL